MDPNEPDNGGDPVDADHVSGDEIDDDAVRRALRTFRTEFLLLITPEGRVIGSSEPDTLGYLDANEGHHLGEYLHPDDLPAIFTAIEEARAEQGFGRTWRARVRRADDTWGIFEGTLLDAREHPELHGAVLRVREVADVEVDGGASDHADRFHSLAEALPLGILSADARGWVVFCNQTAEQIFDLPADELVGRGWERAIHREDRLEVVAAAGQVVSLGQPQQVIFRIESSAQPRWAHAKFVPLRSADESSHSGWIATIDDITDRRSAESQMAYQATHDSLTGLPNRLLMHDRLRQACARLRRGADSVSVLFIDLDGFKPVNDLHGHHIGDQVLIEVARRLRQVIREVDTVARFAGDEFVVITESISERDLGALSGRIGDAIDVPMLLEGERIRIGASVGVATTSDPRVDVDELLALADQQMYRHKRAR